MLVVFAFLFPILFTGFIFLVSTTKKGAAGIESTQPLLTSFVFVLGFFCFVKDNQMIFHCHKETLSCEYWRSTIMRPELRFSRSYDLSDLEYIELKKKRRYSRRGTRTFYRIIFHSGTKTDVFPRKFYNKSDAANEIERLNVFLQTDKKEYLYKEKWYDGLSGFDIGLKYSFFLTTFACMALFIYDRKKKTRKIKRKSLPNPARRKKVNKEGDFGLKNRDDSF